MLVEEEEVKEQAPQENEWGITLEDGSEDVEQPAAGVYACVRVCVCMCVCVYVFKYMYIVCVCTCAFFLRVSEQDPHSG